MALDPDRLNKWFALAANVGVLVGLFVVAYEVRQNSSIAKANTRLEVAHDSYAAALAIATDEGLASALHKFDSGQDVSPVERQRLVTLVFATNAIYENAYFQYRTGMLSEEQWGVFLAGLKATRRGKANLQLMDPEWFSEPYRELVRQVDAELSE